MFQIKAIKPLSIHPSSQDKDSIGIWIERLAISNKITFDVVFLYITKIAKKMGFFQALKKLTRFTITSLSKHQNEFKSNYWKKPNRCPIRKCKYKNKHRNAIFIHLKNRHKVGTEWFICPKCDYQFKTRAELGSHARIVHNVLIYFK